MAIEAIRIFEDLHTLAHRWTQYNSDHYQASFEEFLKENEPGRYERLIAIFRFVEAQKETPARLPTGPCH